MFLCFNFVDVSNVMHHTIYSSVENGRFKLKEVEQFVIKLYYLKKTSTKDDIPETVY